MSTQFHVSDKNGEAGPCNAGKGTNPRGCPFGGTSGTDNHFDTIEEARAYGEQKLKNENGAFSTVSKKENAKQSENNEPTHKVQIDASRLKVGDVIVSEQMTDRGLIDTSSKVIKVEHSMNLNYDRVTEVTYEDNKVGVFANTSPMTVLRNTPTSTSDPKVLNDRVNTLRRNLNKNQYLSPEETTQLINDLNDDNISGMSIARAKRMADKLEDNNQHDTSLRVSAAVERYELGLDSTRKIQDAYSLLYDNQTSDELYKRAAEEDPSAYRFLVRSMSEDDPKRLRPHLFEQ